MPACKPCRVYKSEMKTLRRVGRELLHSSYRYTMVKDQEVTTGVIPNDMRNEEEQDAIPSKLWSRRRLACKPKPGINVETH